MKALKHRQRGIVAVLVAVGLVGLLAMVGLAIESSHLELNKSRLQNTVDAAALAAAKVLDKTGAEVSATAAARSIFDLNAANHPELKSVLSGADITVEYSTTLNPFAPGTIPANYVRVRANDFTMWSSFSMVVGIDELSTAASAVAGPSAPIVPGDEACDLAPMMVCGDPGVGAKGNWGYSGDKVTLLKNGSNAPSPVGPGNFQLVRLGGDGCNIVRQNLAGGYDSCLDTSTVPTQPGDCTGPTAQGLNTRFGEYKGGGMNQANFPPDKVTREPDPELAVADDGTTVVLKGSNEPVTNIDQVEYNYSDYEADLVSGPYNFSAGKEKRRVLAVPIVDCSTMVNGQGTMPVLGFGCFYLLQKVVQKGNENFVYGEYIGQCAAGGAPGPAPGTGGPSIYKIVLHNDPASPDS